MPLPPLSIWHELTRPDSADLVAAAAAIAPGDIAAIERLRKTRSQELVRAALMLAEARRKAAAKFPADVAARVIADPQGVEMATSALAGGYKAARLADTLGPGAGLLDLCCGIGGDAMALTAAGLKVLAIDKDDARSWMAGHNARCSRRCAEAADPKLPDGPFHLDPARRTEHDGGGATRSFQIDDHWPGPSVWRQVILARRDGAIKLGPGLDIEAVRRILPPGLEHETEIISESGRLTQAVLWLGRAARSRRGTRTATLLRPGAAPRSISAEAGTFGEPPTAPLGEFLIEADPSIERAGLLLAASRTTRLKSLAPGLGLLTSDTPAHGPAAEMMTTFRVLDSMPWIEKHIRARLRDLDAGVVEVKTRARAVDPDATQRALRGEGEETLTVFVLRVPAGIHAFITRRLAPGSTPPSPSTIPA